MVQFQQPSSEIDVLQQDIIFCNIFYYINVIIICMPKCTRERKITYTHIIIYCCNFFCWYLSHVVDDDDTTKNFTFVHLTFFRDIGDDNDLQCKA